MDTMSLIINLISGAAGGNAAGAAMPDKSLGTLGNSLAGLVGGGVAGAILQAIIPARPKGVAATSGRSSATSPVVGWEAASSCWSFRLSRTPLQRRSPVSCGSKERSSSGANSSCPCRTGETESIGKNEEESPGLSPHNMKGDWTMRTLTLALGIAILSTMGFLVGAQAGETTATMEKMKGETKALVEEGKGQTKGAVEDVKGNKMSAEAERAKGKAKG